MMSADIVNRTNLKVEKIDIETILNKGVNSLEGYWKSIKFTDNDKLTITENSILTLTSGDTLKITGVRLDFNNLFKTVKWGSSSIIEYKLQGNTDYEKLVLAADSSYRSRLDISAGIDYYQQVAENQHVTFYNKNGVALACATGSVFNLNADMYFVGNNNIDVTSIESAGYSDYDGIQVQKAYPLAVYTYEIDADSVIYRDINNLGTITFTPSDDEHSQTFKLSKLDSNKHILVMLRTDEVLPAGETLSSVTLSAVGATITTFNSDEATGQSMVLPVGLKTLLIKPTAATVELTFTHNHTNDRNTTITVSQPKYLKMSNDIYELNPQLGIDTIAAEIGDPQAASTLYNKLFDKIALEGADKFYYTCPIKNSKVIEEEDLASPYAFFDANNVANKFTMCEIDFLNSSIDVVRGSRL